MALSWRRRASGARPTSSTPESANEVVQQLEQLTERLRIEVDRLERVNADTAQATHDEEGRP